MATATNILATCTLRWIYVQASAVLKLLKAFILAFIAYIDLQIAFLRAQAAQWDLLSKAEQVAWDQFEEILNIIKDEMQALPQGPLPEICPEFYRELVEPTKNLYEATIVGLTYFRESNKDMLSYMDELDQAIAYWEATKALMAATLIVIDDALYAALMREAEDVP